MSDVEIRGIQVENRYLRRQFNELKNDFNQMKVLQIGTIAILIFKAFA